MSISRENFLEALRGVREAIEFEPIAQGALNATISPGIIVLRKGIMVASLVALETFIRERTSEVCLKFQDWPRTFDDLPEKLRLAARLNALGNLQKFARILKKQGNDYEQELLVELTKMASGHGTILQLTRYVAGDLSGNLSHDSLADLLKAFQVNDYWSGSRILAGDTGFGIPSVEELLKNIVSWRHKSAHSANFVPNASDIAELDNKLLCVALCFDVAISVAISMAISSSTKWLAPKFDWRSTMSYILLIAPTKTCGLQSWVQIVPQRS